MRRGEASNAINLGVLDMTWQRVCAIAEIANNAGKKFEFDGISFVLANYGEGFRAFPPFCPHM